MIDVLLVGYLQKELPEMALFVYRLSTNCLLPWRLVISLGYLQIENMNSQVQEFQLVISG